MPVWFTISIHHQHALVRLANNHFCSNFQLKIWYDLSCKLCHTKTICKQTRLYLHLLKLNFIHWYLNILEVNKVCDVTGQLVIIQNIFNMTVQLVLNIHDAIGQLVIILNIFNVIGQLVINIHDVIGQLAIILNISYVIGLVHKHPWYDWSVGNNFKYPRCDWSVGHK